jgi:hypothetical protein
MIRSVIKDTSPRDVNKYNAIRLNKSAIKNADGLKARHNRTPTAYNMVQKQSPTNIYA